MKYILKKLVTLVITLLLISVLTFLIFQVIPGNPVLSILGTDATQERIDAMTAELGLNDPMPQRYFRWISGAVQGDFGKSYRYRDGLNDMMSVSSLISGKLPVTIALAVLSLILIIVISIPLGILWGGTRSKWLDGVFNVIGQLGMSIPSFFLGILVIYFFGLILKVFTPGSFVSYREDFWGFVSYMFFPALSIAVPKAFMTARFLRNSILSQLGSDYVRTAYAKGGRRYYILFKHVLKNALIPVITFIGIIAAEISAGSIVVEQVFGLPGIGRLLVASISSRDFPVVQAIMLYVVSAVVIIYAVVDVLYHVLDPRIEDEV